MHRRTTIIARCFGFLLCLLISSSAHSSRKQAGTAPAGGETKCLVEIAVTRGNSPWQGFTSSYQEEQAGKEVRAETIDPKAYSPLPSLAGYNVKNGPLLARSEERRRVVVNKRFFSDLKRVDATRIRTGESKTIGKFLDLSFASLTPRHLVRFLLESQIVETYWHMESRLCLVEEKTSSGAEMIASFQNSSDSKSRRQLSI